MEGVDSTLSKANLHFPLHVGAGFEVNGISTLDEQKAPSPLGCFPYSKTYCRLGQEPGPETNAKTHAIVQSGNLESTPYDGKRTKKHPNGTITVGVHLASRL